MAVIFAEGFTGVTRGSYTSLSATNPLLKMGWSARSLYNGTTSVDPADTNHRVSIEADAVFATRNRMNMRGALLTTAVTSYFQQWMQTVDTRGFEKFVLGFMFTLNEEATAATPMIVLVTNNVPWTSSSVTTSGNFRFVEMSIPSDGSNGNTLPGGTATPLIKKGKLTHCEILIEQDVDRARTYLDGTLVADVSYTGTFALEAGGFSVIMASYVPQVNAGNLILSDMYLLGLDAVHTGILGPAARVLELAPQTDLDVHWSRPASYGSNAAVLQQNYDTSNPAFLTAGDPTFDLYQGLDAVAANAAQVYGVAVKVNAMSMAEGTHTMSSVVRAGGTDLAGAKAFPLTLGTLKPLVMDASKNPATGVRWTASEVAAAGFGFKLVN